MGQYASLPAHCITQAQLHTGGPGREVPSAVLHINVIGCTKSHTPLPDNYPPASPLRLAVFISSSMIIANMDAPPEDVKYPPVPEKSSRNEGQVRLPF